ncbi:MAG: hypothetical protein Mars2KO_10500 [Maribacter sp.]
MNPSYYVQLYILVLNLKKKKLTLLTQGQFYLNMILFLLQPYFSHFYPTFYLAHQLKSDGQRVVFTATDNLRTKVENEGFEFFDFEFIPEYIMTGTRLFFGILLESGVSQDRCLKRKEEFQKSFLSTQKLVKDLNPDQVYIDQSIAKYYFFFAPYVKNIKIIHTKVYSGKVSNIPPMNSTYIPRKSIVSYLKVEYLWRRELLGQRIREIILRIAFLGKDEIFLWRKHCEKHKIEWKKRIDFKHSLNWGNKNLENIVLIPRKIEFSNFKKNDDIFFSEDIFLKNETQYLTKDYCDFKQKYAVKKENKIIYMAFGTLARGTKVSGFFNAVISIVEELPKTILIISTGNHSLKLIDKNCSFIFDYLPQQDVLSYADLFITHGGLGSIKDAYHYEVPMLVVPMNKYIDQNGNASRVKANGFGERIDIDNYLEREIEQKLIRLLYPIDYLLKNFHKTSTT